METATESLAADVAVTMAADAAVMTTAVCGSSSCYAAAVDLAITAADVDAEMAVDAIPADVKIFKGRHFLSRRRQSI